MTTALALREDNLPFNPDDFISILEARAREHFSRTLGQDWDRYMPLEQEAIVCEWMLTQTAGFSGYLEIIKGKILQRIEQKQLYSHHPSRYLDTKELAIQDGIEMPPSVASDLPFIVNNIFPRAQAAGIDPHSLVPKMANLRLIVPQARQAIKNNDTGTLINLIQEARSNSWRDLRSKINPEPQLAVEIIQLGPDEYLVQTRLSANQLALFKSKFKNLDIIWR